MTASGFSVKAHAGWTSPANSALHRSVSNNEHQNPNNRIEKADVSIAEAAFKID